MIIYKTPLCFYFHPIVVSTSLLLPIFMAILLWDSLQDVSTIIGYIFIFIIAIITILLAKRILKYFIQLIKKEPALTLTESSLFDYQTGQTIDWTDIEYITLSGLYARFISIKLKDKEKYLSHYKNPITVFLYRLNPKHSYGTFSFAVSLLNDNNDEILETLKLYLKSANDKINKNKKY